MGGVAVSQRGLTGKLWGRITTIGLGGCYIEIPSPFYPGTKLELLLGVYGVEARLSGEVRWANPKIGMGIMFTDVEDRQLRELNALITAASRRLPDQA
jgi:hypothetical protein